MRRRGQLSSHRKQWLGHFSRLGWGDGHHLHHRQQARTAGSDSYSTLATLPAGSTSYTDNSVNPGWVYWYELTATDGAGSSASAAVGIQASTGSMLGCSGGTAPQPSGVTGTCDSGAGGGSNGTGGGSNGTGGTAATAPAAAAAAAPVAAAPRAVGGTSTVTGGTPVACQNNQSDAALVQSALNSDSVLSLSGTCLLGSTTLTMASNVTVHGPATLKYTGSQYALASAGNGNTVDSLTFVGGGLELTLNSGQTGQNGWTITNNQFQDITSGSNGINIRNILGKGPHSTISNNTFTNIWQGGYPNFPSGTNQDNLLGTGIYWNQGIDNAIVDSNSFDEIAFDAIKGFPDGFGGHTNPYTAQNVVISNNVMTHVHRMGIETMGGGTNCPGGCDYSHVTTTGMVVKNNYFHNPAFQQGTFAYSIAIDVNGSFINNAAIIEIPSCVWPLGIAIEHELSGGIFQGNVVGAVKQDCTGNYNPTYGWASYICPGYTRSGYTTAYRNNILCGDQAATETAKTNDDPDVSATIDEQYDLWANACPGASNLASSSIVLTFTSNDNQTFASGGDGTWKIAAVSNLPLKSVSFYIDGAATPVAVQELQDVNPSFTSTRQWLYHATTDTTALAAGAHTLTATGIDVSEATRSATQHFTR